MSYQIFGRKLASTLEKSVACQHSFCVLSCSLADQAKNAFSFEYLLNRGAVFAFGLRKMEHREPSSDRSHASMVFSGEMISQRLFSTFFATELSCSVGKRRRSCCLGKVVLFSTRTVEGLRGKNVLRRGGGCAKRAKKSRKCKYCVKRAAFSVQVQCRKCASEIVHCAQKSMAGIGRKKPLPSLQVFQLCGK